jgi:hypothetical protein
MGVRRLGVCMSIWFISLIWIHTTLLKLPCKTILLELEHENLFSGLPSDIITLSNYGEVKEVLGERHIWRQGRLWASMPSWRHNHSHKVPGPLGRGTGIVKRSTL